MINFFKSGINTQTTTPLLKRDNDGKEYYSEYFCKPDNLREITK